MKISFSDIFTRCQNISSYEGSRLKDPQGESMYEVVHINDMDKTLLYEYAVEVTGVIAKTLRFALDNVQYGLNTSSVGADTTFNFIADTSLHGSEANMKKDIEGTIVAYVMWHWMSNKDDLRSKVWQSIYETMMQSLPKGVYRKRPKLGGYPADAETDGDDSTVSGPGGGGGGGPIGGGNAA